MVNESPKDVLLWERRCLKLAERWRMTYVGGGRRAGSNMVAVGPGVDVTSVRESVIDSPLFRPRRGIASAQLRVDGQPFGVVSCHLSLERKRRVV